MPAPDDHTEDIDNSRNAPLNDKTESILDNLFGVTREDEEDVADDAADDSTDDVADDDADDTQDDSSGDSDDSADDSDDTDDEDYDAAPDSKKKKVAESGDDTEEEIKDETMARKIAKERGREVKTLKVDLKEKELALDQERTAREEAERRLQEIEAAQIDPAQHPDFVAKRDEIFADVRVSARRLPGRAKVLLPQNLASLMTQYSNSVDLEGDELLAADERLASQIVSSLELSTIPFDELDADERKELQPHVDRVLDVLERNFGKTRELEQLHVKLSKRSKIAGLTMSVREYAANTAEFQSTLDAVGDLPDEIIEQDPHTIEAVVAKLAKESPEGLKRLKNARRDVLEVLVGPRPLTQDEVDKLEANGTDVKKFLADRNKAHRQKQVKLAAFFVQALMTRSVFKDSISKGVEKSVKKSSDESELDAIGKLKKRRAAPVVEEKKTARRPGSAADKLFGYSDDD